MCEHSKCRMLAKLGPAEREALAQLDQLLAQFPELAAFLRNAPDDLSAAQATHVSPLRFGSHGSVRNSVCEAWSEFSVRSERW